MSSMHPVRTVTLLHVVENKGSQAIRDMRVKEAGEQLRKMAMDLCRPEIKVNLLIRTGDPVKEICTAAEENDV